MSNITKLILVLVLTILLASFASAAVVDDIVHYFANEDTTDELGTWEWKVGGALVLPGFENNAYGFDGVDDYTLSDSSLFDGVYTISLWANTTGGTYTIVYESDGASAQAREMWFGWDNAAEAMCGMRDGGGIQKRTNTKVLTTDKWYHLVCRYNGTALDLIVNGTIEGTVAVASSQTPTSNFSMGMGVGSDYDFTGKIDEVGIWNVAKTNSEISEIYNSGAGFFYPFSVPGGDTINISNGLPINNSQFNIQTLNFNATGNFTSNTNCSFYINSTFNQTTNYTAGTDVLVSWNATLSEGSYNYHINCSNAVTSKKTTTNIFFIDVTNPTITTNFINTSYYYDQNITGQFNFSDNLMLHSFNITIDNDQIYGIFDLNSSSFSYNLSYDIRNLSIGEHTLSVRVADGHTAKELGGDYDVSNGLFNDYLEFEFYDGGSVKMTGLPGSLFDSFTAEREIDRYTFEYEPSDKEADSYSFEVEADESIRIVEKPGYYGDTWLIIDNRKWLDFVLDNEPNASLSITRITPKKVNVTITGLAYKDLLSFSSIGDLNIVTQNYTFYNTNATVSYTGQVAERQSQTISFDINKTGTITSTNASLYYNNTLYSTTKTAYSNYDNYVVTFTTPVYGNAASNISVNWSYDIFGSVNNVSGSIMNYQTVSVIGIDNCSTYSMRSVNISIYNETSDTLVNSNLDGYFEVWLDDINNYSSFNLTWANINTSGICIYPNWTTYNVYGQLEYQDVAGGFTKKTYYWYNTTFSNTTQLLNLYLTDDTTVVTFTVADENDDPVEEAYIKVLSYDLGTNSYVTTEILKTDTDGKALGNIVLNTQWYQFIVEYENEIRLTTEPQKLTLTTYTFRINLVEDIYEHYDTYRGVATSLTFTNATRTFRYTFSDPTSSVQQGCLEIIKRTVNGDTLVNSSCVVSSAATISLTIPESPDGTYIGTGSININPSFVTDVITAVFGGNWTTFGLTGVFVSFLLVVALVTVGLWSPIVAVIMMTVGVIATVLLEMFYLSWPILISFIIVAGITIYRLSRR